MSEGQGNLGGQQGGGQQGGGQQGGGDWKASLPAELQSHGALKNFTDPGQLAKSYVELNGRFSSRKMADMDVPSDPEGRKAVLTKLGITPPASPDEYGLSFPDTFKGFKDTETLKGFAKTAHELGLTKDQAAGLFKANLAHAENVHKFLEDRKAADAAAVKEKFSKEWGADYENRMARVKQAWEEFMPEGTRKRLEDLGFNNNPDLIGLFDRIAQATREGKLITGSGNSTGTGDLAAKRAAMQKFENDNKAFILSVNEINPEVRRIKGEWNRMRDEITQLEIAADEQKGAA